MLHLRVLEDLVELVDRPRRDLGRLEALDPCRGRGVRQGRLDPRPELVVVDEAGVVGLELRVGRERLVAERLREARVLVGVHDHDLHPAVLGSKGLRGCQVRVTVADARRALARVEVVGDGIGQERERRGQEAHVEVLAAPGPLAMHERGVRHPEREKAGGEVGHRAADLCRRAPRHARERHDPAHTLRDRVVARALRVRPRLAETRHRHVDHRRIHGAHRGVADAELVGDTGEEVLDDHVRAPGQLEDEPGPLGLLHVHGDAALVAIDRRERRAHAVAAPRAEVVAAAGALDLDDVGAEVRHEGRTVGTRDDAGEVEDAEAVEHRGRLSHGRENPPSSR